MNTENETLNTVESEGVTSFNFKELEQQLEASLNIQLSELDYLANEKEKINNPNHLGEIIKTAVWEQFMNQMATQSGEDFIKENNDLKLDLRDDAHIQIAENFAEGKIAKHNYQSRVQLENNYDRVKNKPHKEFRKEYVNQGTDAILERAGQLNKKGTKTVTDIYTGRQIPTQTKMEDGSNNPLAAQREHVKPSAKVYENPSLQMANNDQELAAIINSPENLQGYTTAERNLRKSDNTADEMQDRDKNKHWEKANERAEDYIKQKEIEGEERLEKEGRKTQKEEVLKIGGKALRTMIMQLLAELCKEIFAKLVKWFQSAKRTMSSLIEYIKSAIKSFINKLKAHILNAGKSMVQTIVTAIVGPIVGTIRKVWIMLKQGGKSIKEAWNYIKSPENKEKSISMLVMEVGKIIIAGLSATTAILLGEIIEKGLMTIPVLAIEIPIIGSLANIIGLFLGGAVAGIIGAIAINLIDKRIAKQREQEILSAKIDGGNKILQIQSNQIEIAQCTLNQTRTKVGQVMYDRHKSAADRVKSVAVAIENCGNTIITTDNEEQFNDIDNMLKNLQIGN